MSNLNLRPLAKVQYENKRATLSTTPAQDQYYLVYTNGDYRKITVVEAVRMYVKAGDDERNLVWKKGVQKREAKRQEEQEPAESAREWRNRLREALDLPPLGAAES